MRIGSLFSGAGGLDMAVEQVFGGEVIWQSEVDKAASKVLEYRFPCAPNLGDITAIDWKTVEPPDVLCGGFPCQDVSAAGKRAGIKDGTRSGLWSVFADAIDQLRPPLVVIENVRGLLSAQAHRNVEPDEATVGDRSDGPVLRALGAVLGDLADLGYDAQWTTFAASSIGAPHRRERVFIIAALATDSEGGARRIAEQQHLCAGGRRPWQSGICSGKCSACGADATNSPRNGRDEGRPESARIVGGFDAAVSGDEPGVALLPTPSACNANDGEGTETWLARREVVKARVKNGNGMGMPLSIAVQLLPTPTTQDGANNGGPSQFQRNTLPLNAEVTLLPTPRTSDTNGAGVHGDGGMDLRTTIRLLPTPKAGEGNGGGNYNSPGHQSTVSGTVREIEQWGKYAAAIHRWEQIAGPAPAPTEPNKNGNPRLSAAFSEWMMGWPRGWVTDPDIGISRNDQLKIVGNGVCPQQAVAALTYLLSIAEVEA